MCPPEHTPTAIHNSIVHTEMAFGCSRCRPRVTQRPIHYNVFRDVRTLAIDHNSVGLRWPRFQKTGFRTENIVLIILLLTSTCRLPLSLSLYVHLVSTLRNLLNLHLANPKVDDFPFSIQSAILYALLKLICYAFVHPCSFGRSL